MNFCFLLRTALKLLANTALQLKCLKSIKAFDFNLYRGFGIFAKRVAENSPACLRVDNKIIQDYYQIGMCERMGNKILDKEPQ